MHSAKLRKVGGSVMLAVPPALLDALDLSIGTKVDLGVDDGRIIVYKRKKPSYTLKELLDQYDDKLPIDDEDRQWLESKPVGNELL
ncbi:MAG: antitoxin [Gammaproteobacteria bacterium]|nr:antitoxin [Gammaproteobacteria bacterium]